MFGCFQARSELENAHTNVSQLVRSAEIRVRDGFCAGFGPPDPEAWFFGHLVEYCDHPPLRYGIWGVKNQTMK